MPRFRVHWAVPCEGNQTICGALSDCRCTICMGNNIRWVLQSVRRGKLFHVRLRNGTLCGNTVRSQDTIRSQRQQHLCKPTAQPPSYKKSHHGSQFIGKRHTVAAGVPHCNPFGSKIFNSILLIHFTAFQCTTLPRSRVSVTGHL